MVAHYPPTSEVCGSNPGPFVGRLVVAYRWLAVYGKELIVYLYRVESDIETQINKHPFRVVSNEKIPAKCKSLRRHPAQIKNGPNHNQMQANVHHSILW